MNTYLQDILDQPQSLRQAFECYLSADNLRQMEALKKQHFDRIIFTGMGSSHYAGFGASLILNQHGMFSVVKSASQLLHYEADIINRSTLLFLVSQSGESAEIVNVIKKIPPECPIVAITNDPNSTLARRGNYIFLLHVAEEESVTTRTYVASLLLLNLLAQSMTGGCDEHLITHFRAAITSMAEFLTHAVDVSANIRTFLQTPAFLHVIGRGFSYSTVFAGGLFINEVAKFPCKSIDSGEFRHGPWEIIDENFTGIVLAPQGVTYQLSCRLAQDIVERGGNALLLTNHEPGLVHPGIFTVKLPATEEFLAPLVDILPIQLTANFLAESKNVIPGKFRWSSKITDRE